MSSSTANNSNPNSHSHPSPKAPLPQEEEPSSSPVSPSANKSVVEEFPGMVEKLQLNLAVVTTGDFMEEDSARPETVFCIKLKQPSSNLLHKMRVPELCRTFSAVAWCPKLNAIACASETCARIPSSTTNPPFWIPIHIVIPERPTEGTVFNVTADSPRDSIQFIEWSPISCPRALLVANFYGRVTIWTQPSQGPVNLVKDASYWQLEYQWRQDIAVVTKWLSGVSPYRWLSSRSTGSGKMTLAEKFLSQQPYVPAGWPNFLCVCTVFSSGSVQLHWSQWPPNKNGSQSKWFCTNKGLLGAGPCGIMAADAIITDSGALHIAGVPIVNLSTVVVWEVMPGPGNGFHVTPKATVSNEAPPSLNPPSWNGFSPLAAYLFSWQDFLESESKQGRKRTEQDYCDMVALHCSPVSNFSAYVSPEAAAQSTAVTTWGSGVTAVAFDPARGGSVISVVIVEGQYMSPYDPDEGPSVTGWRVQRWESSVENVVIHPIFGSPGSNFNIQAPKQTVWVSKVIKCIPTSNCFFKFPGAAVSPIMDGKSPESSIENVKSVSFDPFDLPSDIRTLARIVYSAHGGEIAVTFLRGGVHVFSSASFSYVDSYQINSGAAIATLAFSSTSCCSASVWHDTNEDCTVLQIVRVLPPPIPCGETKANSATWERAIAERFWWSLLVGVDWWDAVGCTQSAAEDDIVSLGSVISVLDADFHSLPTLQHREQYGPSLDRIKCRLLEGTTAQEVRAMVLDMQARLLLGMLGKGIESALINPSALMQEPWQVSGDTLSGLDPEAMAVEPALTHSIQAYVDAVLDLASHFITRLRRYASFCRTLASHAATAGTGGSRNMVMNTTQSTSTSTSQGSQIGNANSQGSSNVQAWVQGAIAKITGTTDGAPNSTPSNISGPSTFMPISINTGTFPGTPAVRLIGDCHFLQRLCQLLLFCFFFRRSQLPRVAGAAQRGVDSSIQKPQTGAPGKAEDSNSASVKLASNGTKADETPVTRGGNARSSDEGPTSKSRIGSGNAGQGYTFEEVKVLFLILIDLCRRTSGLPHPLPASQVGSSNIQVRLHYIDGNYTVLPEVVEASLGPHMQNMPRPRGADAAGLLLRELELHPPAEEWHKKNMFGGPWLDHPDNKYFSDESYSRFLSSADLGGVSSSQSAEVHSGAHTLWPRKRRMSERDAAFGLTTSVGLGAYYGIMGSRRDIVTALWKTGLEGVWYKCIRCLRQTCAFASPGDDKSSLSEKEMWWISRWAYGCPMCGGAWVRVV